MAPLLTEQDHFGLASKIVEVLRGRATEDGREYIQVRGIRLFGGLGLWYSKLVRERCTCVRGGWF